MKKLNKQFKESIEYLIEYLKLNDNVENFINLAESLNHDLNRIKKFSMQVVCK